MIFIKIIFFGRPGSGKGTYASRIAPQLGIVHIGTGDMYRAEVAAQTELGKLAEKFMKNGQLVPDDVTIKMFEERIAKSDVSKGFILDGFPRTMEQVKALEGMTKIDLVINFELDEDVIIEKALARRICEKCGNIYNIADIRRGSLHLPPLLPKTEGVCDKCGSRLIQRKDDNYETIKERQDIYMSQSTPLIDYYEEKGLLVNVPVVGGPDIMVPIILDVIGKQKN